MNLPILSQLRENESTYITFSKSLLDLDKAISTNGKYYFSKMVALNLPVYENPNFYLDLSSVGVVSQNPNVVFPKAIEYYMENIIRQSISVNGDTIDEITELAFWKLMKKMGLDFNERKNLVTFTNGIYTSNFYSVENNNGWAEIVCQIPNKCETLIPAWKTIPNIKPIVQANDEDVCMFDNGDKQFLFDSNEVKTVFDFDNVTYNNVTESEFDFNCLLLFYSDDTGKQKLHGINFIYPFENKVTYWDINTFKQKTNKYNTIGYQFKFNQKTCNNEATQTAVYELQEHTHWNTFAETLGLMNSFLTEKIKE